MKLIERWKSKKKISHVPKISQRSFSTQTQESILPQENQTKTDLSSWGLPSCILNKYHEKGIHSMFPWQVECLLKGKVLQWGNLVYSAPTSAGKTMVAELLMLKCVLERSKKGIMILPFVSLAREKMIYFQQMFHEAGIKVDGYMGSHNPPGGFGNIDLALCTIEKANGLINRLMEEGRLKELGVLVVDELHLLGDHHRGYLLELLLTKILFTNQKNTASEPIQIVGMSATLPNLELLATWLNADFYQTDYRPVPLSEMVKIGPRIYNCETMNLRRELTNLDLSFPNDPDHLYFLALETILEGHAVLIFCPTKNWCETLARDIAKVIYKLGCLTSPQQKEESVTPAQLKAAERVREVFNGEQLHSILEQLKRSPAGLDAILSQSVSFGVAYHHAGLTIDERDIIESAFRQGIVKVLIATTTLSSGVNLPARRVIIRSPLFRNRLMDVLSYKQMVGRAGRKGTDTQGESILICKETEQNLAKQLVTSGLKPIKSCLVLDNSNLSSSLKRAILEVIASGVANKPDEVEKYTSCTLLAASISKDELAANNCIDICISYLKDNEFIFLQTDPIDGSLHYQPTKFGQAVLSSSLAPDEGLRILHELKKARRCFVLESDLHLIYQVTPPYLSDLFESIDWLHYMELWERLSDDMKRVGELVGVEERFLARCVRGSTTFSSAKQIRQVAVHRRFYAALALNDLVNEMPLYQVSNKYDCNRGILQGLQQSAATFAGMVTIFCSRLGWTNLELLLAQYNKRLHFGVSHELCELVQLPSVNGKLARVLFDADMCTLAEVAAAGVNKIYVALKNSAPFQSDKADDAESSFEIRRKKDIRNLFITGRKGLTEMEAAELIVDEARNFIQDELGIKITDWAKHLRQMEGSYESEGSSGDQSVLSQRSSSSTQTEVPTQQPNTSPTPDIVPITCSKEPSKLTESEMVQNTNPSTQLENAEKLPSPVLLHQNIPVIQPPGKTDEIQTLNEPASLEIIISETTDILCSPLPQPQVTSPHSEPATLQKSLLGCSTLINMINQSEAQKNSTRTDQLLHVNTVETSKASKFSSKPAIKPTSPTKQKNTKPSSSRTVEKASSSDSITSNSSTSSLIRTPKKMFALHLQKSPSPRKSKKVRQLFCSLKETISFEENIESLNLIEMSPDNFSSSKTQNSSKESFDTFINSAYRSLSSKTTPKKQNKNEKPKNLNSPKFNKFLDSFQIDRTLTNLLDKPYKSPKGKHKHLSKAAKQPSFKKLRIDAILPEDSNTNNESTNRSQTNAKGITINNVTTKISEDKSANNEILTGKALCSSVNDALIDESEIILSNQLFIDRDDNVRKTSSQTETFETQEDHSISLLNNGQLSSQGNQSQNGAASSTICAKTYTHENTSKNSFNFMDSCNINSQEFEAIINKASTTHVKKVIRENDLPNKIRNLNNRVINNAQNDPGDSSRPIIAQNELNLSNNITKQGRNSITFLDNCTIDSQILQNLENEANKVQSTNPSNKIINQDKTNCNNSITFLDSCMIDSQVLNELERNHAINNYAESEDIFDKPIVESQHNGADDGNLESQDIFEVNTTKNLVGKKIHIISKPMIILEPLESELMFTDKSSPKPFVPLVNEVTKISLSWEDKNDAISPNINLSVGYSPSLMPTVYKRPSPSAFLTPVQKKRIRYSSASDSSIAGQSDDCISPTPPRTNATTTQRSIDNYSSPSLLNISDSPMITQSEDLFDLPPPSRNKTISTIRSSKAPPFNIIDVTADPNLFQIFVKDWKKQKTFAISLALESRSLSTRRGIGPPVNNVVDTEEILEGLPIENDPQTLLTGVSILWHGGDIYYLSFKHQEDRVALDDTLLRPSQPDPSISIQSRIKVIQEVFSSTSKRVIAFEWRNVLNKLRKSVLKFVNESLVWNDPQMASWLDNPVETSRTLTCLAKFYKLNHTFQNLKLSNSSRLQSAKDVFLVMKLMDTLATSLKKKSDLYQVFKEVEMPNMVILTKMEQNGLGFNASLAEQICSQLEEQMTSLGTKAQSLAPSSFRLQSSLDVARILYKELRLKLPPGAMQKTSKETLEKLRERHELPGVILEWRKVSNTISRVIRPLLNRKSRDLATNMYRIHGNCEYFSATGRISMHEPSLQCIPRDFDLENFLGVSLRQAFVPCEGCVLISADYGQLELRMLAHLSQDPILLADLNSGMDVFKSIAATWKKKPYEEVTDCDRHQAKQICYGIIYGMGASTLATQLGVEDSEAEKFLKSFKKVHPVSQTYLNLIVEECTKRGYVETLAKRRRYLPLIVSGNNSQKSAARRQAINTTIQGSAADLVKIATVKTNKDLEHYISQQPIKNIPRIALVLQLHDELMYEVTDSVSTQVATIIQNAMQSALSLSLQLPVNVKIGSSWASLKKVHL